MNKYQEAWKFLNNVISSTDIDRIMPLKDLIDKETPMKAQDFKCPTCNDFTVTGYDKKKKEREDE